jgi:hypothetical protein
MARSFGACVAAIALSLLAAAAHAESRFADDAATLRKIAYDAFPKDPAEALKARFASTHDRYEAANEAQLSDDEIRDYFDASYTVAAYAHDRRSVESMRAALDALTRRGIDSDAQRQNVLDMYIEARLVPEAVAFSREPANARLVPLPSFAPDPGDAHPPTLWRMSADGTTVERDAFTLGDAPRVLVVSSPWCHFTEDATAAIAKDTGLSSLMQRHSTWIMPQQPIPNFAKIAKWNRDYPGWPMHVIYDEADWPMIPSPQTPVFYFIDHGKVAETVTGWPGDAQKDVLRAAFAKAGMQ